MLTDLRLALRQLWKNPGFTLVAVLALALGIGANTAIFTVVNAVLLKPLPFPEPDRLVSVGSVRLRDATASGVDSISYPDFFDFRARARSFAALACHYENGFALTGGTEAQGVRGLVVAGGFFEAVGLRPFLGRGFAREDEAPGGGPGGLKTVLSHAFWQRQFRGDPAALGQKLTVDGLVFTVVGVMPAGVQFPLQSAAIDLYLPLAKDAAVALAGDTPPTEQRGAHMLRAVGRLLPGVPVEQAQAELRAIAADLEKQYPDSNTHFSASAVPLREDLVGDVRTALWVLCGAVGQRGQPPPRARFGAGPRDGGAHGLGREPGPDRAPAPHRERGARRAGRRAGPALGGGRIARAGGARSAEHPARRRPRTKAPSRRPG